MKASASGAAVPDTGTGRPFSSRTVTVPLLTVTLLTPPRSSGALWTAKVKDGTGTVVPSGNV